MKTFWTKSAAALAGLALMASASMARADFISLNVSSLAGSSIGFIGGADAFQFKGNPTGNDISLTPLTGGKADGLGEFTSGNWTLGTIQYTSVGEWATVTTSSTFKIPGAGGAILTANVGLTTITVNGGKATLDINLTGITYGGNNADLKALAVDKNATIQLAFSTGESLFAVEANGISVRSYGGTISAVPEATTSWAGMGSIGLLCLGTGLFKRSKNALRDSRQ